MLFALFAVVIQRLLKHAAEGATNFERLFAAGVAILFLSHFFVHIGMNIGLLPVTGTTIPFLSYGGSHLLTEFTKKNHNSAMRQYCIPPIYPPKLNGKLFSHTSRQGYAFTCFFPKNKIFNILCIHMYNIYDKL